MFLARPLPESPCTNRRTRRPGWVSAALFATLVVAGSLAGCGPTLLFRDGSPIGYHVATGDGGSGCSQGPFLIERAAFGGRWGEQLEVRVQGPRGLSGLFELRVGERIVRRGHWRTGVNVPGERNTTRYVPDTQIANGHCLERPQVVAEAAPAPEPKPPAPAPTVAVVEPAPPAPAPPAEAPRVHGPAVLEPGAVGHGSHHASIVTWHVEHRRSEGSAGVEPGTRVQVWIWSPQPIDWHGASFMVRHAAAKPSVSESEWVAHLRKEEAEHRREVEVERRERRKAAEKASRERKKEADARWRAGAAGRKAAADRGRFCATHHDDVGCWGEGGYNGHLRRQQERADQLRLEREVTLLERQTRREVAEEQAAIAAYVRPEPVRVCLADEPPPPAPAEVLPPQPTLHSQWVAGYWTFSCEGWFWLPGWWKVPEADLRVEVHVAAPAAPPPLRVEVRPPCPLPGAIWVVGHWFWSHGRWVWVGGRWALPPRAGVVWRGGVWLPVPGGGVRFDPGRWELRVRIGR